MLVGFGHAPDMSVPQPKGTGIDSQKLDSTPESPEDESPKQPIDVERARAGSVESQMSEATVSTATTAKKDPPPPDKDSKPDEKKEIKVG